MAEMLQQGKCTGCGCSTPGHICSECSVEMIRNQQIRSVPDVTFRDMEVRKNMQLRQERDALLAKIAAAERERAARTIRPLPTDKSPLEMALWFQALEPFITRANSLAQFDRERDAALTELNEAVINAVKTATAGLTHPKLTTGTHPNTNQSHWFWYITEKYRKPATAAPAVVSWDANHVCFIPHAGYFHAARVMTWMQFSTMFLVERKTLPIVAAERQPPIAGNFRLQGRYENEYMPGCDPNPSRGITDVKAYVHPRDRKILVDDPCGDDVAE